MKTGTVLKSISKSLCLLAFLFLIYSCQEKESPVPEEESRATITDIDGNVYGIVEINGIWWMAENLRVSKFLNGVSIDNVSNAESWSEFEGPAFSWLENDSNNDLIYGKLYNGYTVSCCPICPEGWRLPNSKEVENLSLERFKSQSTFVYHELGWANEYTFSGGYRIANGLFIKDDTSDGSVSYFWEFDEGGVPYLYRAAYIVDFAYSAFIITPNIRSPAWNRTGAYIRCVKEK